MNYEGDDKWKQLTNLTALHVHAQSRKDCTKQKSTSAAAKKRKKAKDKCTCAVQKRPY